LKEQLTALARELGFAACAFASLTPVDQEGTLHPQAASLAGDARSLMPDAKCVMLCAMPYSPFRAEKGQAHIDAYYIASNAAHGAVQLLARRIEEALPVRALASPPVFIKPLAVRSGLGEFGRSGLVSVGQYGTRVSLQVILLDADIETHDHAEKSLSSLCARCNACVNACPTGALDGTGRVDITRCLRAQPEGAPYPESMRSRLGSSLLGCDICQRVCPGNEKMERMREKSDQSAFALEELLACSSETLARFGELYGRNYAIRNRIIAQALLAAGNSGNMAYLPQIEALTASPSPLVREHAQWAAKRMKELQKFY